MPNAFQPDWDFTVDEGDWQLKVAMLGRQARAEKLGASLYEIAPGSRVSPLHTHHANEELIIVLSGRPTLRTPDGERELEEGEVVACLTGRRGAHQVLNRSDAPARVLIASTMVYPEVAEHLDSNKVLVMTRPFGAEGDDAFSHAFRRADEVDVREGET